MAVLGFRKWAEIKDLKLFLYTQKIHFSQIFSTNLSKSVLVSTWALLLCRDNPSHLKGVAYQDADWTAWLSQNHQKRPLWNVQFCLHTDTVTRSWGPLMCHSSTTITSCCSMIMHGRMLQGSLHNSWKLKTSQFLHGQHTHQTCHHLSMFGKLWIRHVYDMYTTACSSSCQYPATSHSHWRGVDQHLTGHN